MYIIYESRFFPWFRKRFRRLPRRRRVHRESKGSILPFTNAQYGRGDLEWYKERNETESEKRQKSRIESRLTKRKGYEKQMKEKPKD